MNSKCDKGLFWLCLSVMILTPLSNDVFIGAFSIMEGVFDTDHLGLLLSVHLAGLALGQPFYGPLSDRFGRKPILLIGIMFFLLGSLVTLLAGHFPLFLVGRFIQGVGACGTLVSVFAIVRDTYTHDRLVHTMGIVMAMVGICPALAPLLGSVLTEWMGWQASFYFLAFIGLFYFLCIRLFFVESQKEKNLHAMRFKFIIRNYIDMILNKCYFLYCLVSAFSYGLFFTYISLSSFYIVGLLNYSIISLGWIVLLNALIIFFGSLFVPRYSLRYGLDRVVFWGTGLLFFGGVGMTISLLLWGFTLLSFMCPMAVVTLGVGFIRPTASAGALKEADKRVAGSAASGFNFISFVGGSVCTSIGGWFVEDPLYFAIFVFVLGGIAGGLAWLNCREHKKNLLKEN